jgi:hypothetical protein
VWQANVGSGSGRATNYRDFLTKIVAAATSQHVATVAVNAGGTGYVVGDVVELPHAGAYLVARFEVLTVGGSGEILTLRIVSNGAYGDRAASATVSAGGSGYAVGNILEVQGGTQRNKAKFQVATLSVSAVATVTLFEDGGAYSATPSNPAATSKVGPTAGTGSGCTLTITYTGLIGTTGLAVTGGTGSAATVDITLAETGWTCERNTNSATFNSITNEKQVVLKGDAAGFTNKPYVGFATGTSTSGINTRPFIGLVGMIAHNPALALASQPNVLGDPGTFSASRPYICCNENTLQEMDFWLTIDDTRIGGILNINSNAAATDDGRYMQWYAGYMDTFAMETENPYPMFVGASSRDRTVDPALSSINHSGLAECCAPTAAQSGHWFYRAETATWVNVANSVNFNTSAYSQQGMAPMVRIQEPSGGSGIVPLQWIATYGPLEIYTGIGSVGRAAATRRLLPCPGTTPKFFPIPLTLLSRQSTQIDQVLDSPRGQLRGFFWVYNTNSAGATIVNFSEDYLEIGTDRYRIFHNHANTQTYQYICIRESV